jgi:hypothetical protein
MILIRTDHPYLRVGCHKGLSPLLHNLRFIVGLAEGVFHHGIRARRSRVRAPDTHILLRIILVYRSSYGGARIAQTSKPLSGVMGPWLARSRGNIGT